MDLLILPLFLLPLLLYLLFNGWRRSTSNLPPSPPRLPIIGNLHQLSSLPHHSLRKLSRRVGPIMLLQMGQVRTIVVSSPELAAEVLKNQDHIFADRPRIKVAELLMHGQKNVAFAKYGEYWRTVKKICVVQLLSSRKVQGFRSVREEEAGRMVANIREIISSAGPGTPVDLSQLLYRFANGIMFRSSTSSLPGSTTAKRFREIVDEINPMVSGFRVDDIFPAVEWIWKLAGMYRKTMDLFRRLDTFLGEIVDQHEGGAGGDFVDVLLSLQKNPQMDFALSRDDIKALILDMNLAGTDTTYTILEWIMSELLRNPSAMSKIKQELMEVAGGKATVTEEHLSRLHYLKAVVKEALRLHPPVPLLIPHKSMQETQIHGYTVPKGTQVIVNVWALARDPQWWDSPEEFSPERFMGGQEGDGRGDFKGQDFRFLPFGSGRRSCPGMQFAMVMLELALANILNQFDWELPPGVELDMIEAPGVIVRRANPLRVIVKPCDFS